VNVDRRGTSILSTQKHGATASPGVSGERAVWVAALKKVEVLKGGGAKKESACNGSEILGSLSVTKWRTCLYPRENRKGEEQEGIENKVKTEIQEKRRVVGPTDNPRRQGKPSH